MNKNINQIVEEGNFSEVPVITMSSPSVDTDSEASPIYRNITKLSNDIHSDEEIDHEMDTSFINYYNNNVIDHRVSFIRSLSPVNLNSTNVSRYSQGNVRRWSQSLTNASKSRQNRSPTINMMPSRLQKIDETDFERFVHEIEQYGYLMENSATATEMRNQILRVLPQSLCVKRQIKSKITSIVKERCHRIGMNRWKRALHFIGLCSNKCKNVVRNFTRNLELWRKSMKDIQGQGASADTYFRFFRFLFVVNLFLMIISFVFIVLPQLVDDYFQNSAVIISRSPLSSVDKMIDEINILDFFTAEGSLENSTLFYGAYTNQRIKLYGSTTYSLPFAYLMTMVCFYAVTFITLSIITAESYRKSFIATSGGEILRAHTLFCAWDFGVSNQKAADMKHLNIYHELKSILNQLYDNEQHHTSIGQKIVGCIISAVIWILVALVLIVIGCSIVFFTDFIDYFCESEHVYSYIADVPLFVPTVTVILLFMCQSLFEFLGFLEIKLVRMYRSPQYQLHIALVRNYLLNIVTISSLVWFWLKNTEERNCWETWIAQNIYRLLIIEFVIVVCIGSILRIIRFLIYKHLWANIGLSEFNIARGCLGLIFNQTLLWIGIFFSPPLATVVVLKMMATFYLKKVMLINFCKPPSKLWRSSHTFTLFLSINFISLTIVIVILLYILTQMHVSKTCGPFRNHLYMFHVLRGDILKLQENHFLWQLIMCLARPAAIGLYLLTLCVLVYYLRTKSKARIEMVKLLKQMLYIETKDKQFLLANITRINNKTIQANDNDIFSSECLVDELLKETHSIRPHTKNPDKFQNKINSEFATEEDDSFYINNTAPYIEKGSSISIRKRLT